jgi:hypothetical protein
MSEWTLAQTEAKEELAQLHSFSMKKHQDGKTIEFVITVREFATPQRAAGRFYAQADKQTNQKLAPYTPSGWGSTLVKALSECVQAIHRYPYQGPEMGGEE